MSNKWGSGKWATGVWSGTGGRISLVGAVAIGTNVVRVTLSDEPKNQFRSAVGDALNPWMWSVTRVDTGQRFTIGQIARYTATQYDITVYEPFGDYLTQHQVSTVVLQARNGSTIVPPRAALFAGVLSSKLATPEQQVATRRRGQRDIANPPIMMPGGGLGGTRIIRGGDYATDQGESLLIKMIVRRLITPKGAFFHLPTFGLGLAIKGLIRPADLPLLQKDIQVQLLEEPDITAVKATCTLIKGQGTLVIRIAVRSPLVGSSGANYTFQRDAQGVLQRAA